MATPDRILQLKLVSDTSGVSQDLSKTTKNLTRIQRAQGKMRAGWKRMGPAIKTGFTMALDVGVDLLQRGFAEMEEGEKVARDLERVLTHLGKNSARNLELISDAADNALSLNFDDEDFTRSVGLVEQHFQFSIPRAIDTVNAAMDVAAARFDGDLPRALNVVEAALRGKKKAFEQLGIPMKFLGNKAKTLRWILHHFAGSAKEDANTISGRWGQTQKRMDNILGDIVTSARDGLVQLTAVADENAPLFDAAINVYPKVAEGALGLIGTKIKEKGVGITTQAVLLGINIFQAITGETAKIPGAVGEDVQATEAQINAINVATFRAHVQKVLADTKRAMAGFETDTGNWVDRLEAIWATWRAPGFLGTIARFVHWPNAGVPELAEGGIVDRPTLAVIGERGPEAVVPLGSGGGMPFGGVVVNITTGVGDPVEIGRQVDRVLRAYRGRAGVAA